MFINVQQTHPQVVQIVSVSLHLMIFIAANELISATNL